MQSLADCTGLQTQHAITALRHEGGDLSAAVRKELMRIPLDAPVVRRAVLEYCAARGMSAGTLASRRATPDACSRRDSERGAPPAAPAAAAALEAAVAAAACGAAAVSDAGRRAEAFAAWLDAVCAAVEAGDVDGALARLAAGAPGDAGGAPALRPEVQFKLRRLRVLQLVEAGDIVEAHAAVRGTLGPLAVAHPSLEPLLRVRRCPHRAACCELLLRRATSALVSTARRQLLLCGAARIALVSTARRRSKGRGLQSSERTTPLNDTTVSHHCHTSQRGSARFVCNIPG